MNELMPQLRDAPADKQPSSVTRPMTRPRYLWGLGLIALVYLLLAFGFSRVMPFNKGPDEGINLDYIEFIVANGRLPVTYAERDEVGPKANWPALYHLSVVGLSKVLGLDLASPPSIKIFWDSFRYRAIDTQGDEVWYLRTEDQQPPYYGPFLALQIGRWLSILLSLMTLFLVYLTTLEIFPQQPWLSLTATALLAFIPQFIFVGSALNEDALVAVLAALYFWLLVRVFKQPEKLWPYSLLGLTLGLSVTAKYTTIVLPLEVALVLVVLVRRDGHRWWWGGWRLAIVGGSALLASSWWFGWNFWFLNEIKELGLVAGLLRPLFTGGTDVTLARLGNFFSGGQIGLTSLPDNTQIGTISEWVWITFLSLWGVNIGGVLPLSVYAYTGVGLVVAAAAVGLWRLWRLEPASRQWLLLMAGHIAIFLILPLVRFGLSRRLGQTAQGRHILIPAAAAIAILLAWGLAGATPKRWRRWTFSLLIAGLIGWSAAHLYRLDTFAAMPLPVRTLPQAAEWLPEPAGAKFGETVELVSYGVDPQLKRGELHLNLAWRSLAHVNENYLLTVTLLDAQGEVRSYWQGYNGQGRLPTLAWDPGDSVFDRLVLPLPNLPAGDYTVQVQLNGAAGSLPITGPVCEERGKACGDKSGLTLAHVTLSEPSSLPLPQQMKVTGLNNSAAIAFALWQTQGPAETSRSPLSDSRLPIYRYPATISIIASPPAQQGAMLDLQLVDDTGGQAWPAEHRAANIFTFVIGPRWLSGPYRLKMTLRQEEEIIGQATSEPLLAVENWWKRDFEVPAIASPGEANFANQLKFLGYTLPQNQVKAGESFPLTLYWQALPDRAPQADFIQFNHLLDSNGVLRGGYDRRPLEYYSTVLWAPGEVVTDGYVVPVAADAPPGQYYLNVGYYLTVGESAVTLPLVVNGQMSDVTSVSIGPIQVVR